MTRRFIGEYARAIGKWIIYINKGIAGLEYLFVKKACLLAPVSLPLLLRRLLFPRRASLTERWELAKTLDFILLRVKKLRQNRIIAGRSQSY